MATVSLLPGGALPPKVSYVVIAARHRGRWLMVRHRIRGGWEMPAGHPEPGEETIAAAARELTEETGADRFTLEPVAWYSVDTGSEVLYGRFFLAEVESLGEINDREEIERVRLFDRLPDELSLPEVMTFLFGVAEEYVRERE